MDRSLYSSRAYASKHPVLSPITEFLSCSSRPPTSRGAGELILPGTPGRLKLLRLADLACELSPELSPVRQNSILAQN